MTNPWIVIEGCEFAGKSTLAVYLRAHLQRAGIRALVSREPGGTAAGELIRGVLKSGVKSATPTQLTQTAELLLMQAARVEHLTHKILPKLQENQTVICDRFVDSSWVYQHKRGLVPIETYNAIANVGLPDFTPQITFVLTLPGVEVVRRREEARRVYFDCYDELPAEEHDKICELYQALVHDRVPYPNGLVPLRVEVRADRAPEDVFNAVISAL